MTSPSRTVSGKSRSLSPPGKKVESAPQGKQHEHPPAAPTSPPTSPGRTARSKSGRHSLEVFDTGWWERTESGSLNASHLHMEEYAQQSRSRHSKETFTPQQSFKDQGQLPPVTELKKLEDSAELKKLAEDSKERKESKEKKDAA